MKTKNFFTSLALVSAILIAGCQKDELASSTSSKAPRRASAQLLIPTGSASNFAVLAGTTITNDGASLITQSIGVNPGSAITGFQMEPMNTIEGPGTVTAGLGIVNGTIFAGGAVAAQAHNDAVMTYSYLAAQTPDTIYSGVTELDGLTLTPGVYQFASSANLKVDGTLILDFQGNSDAVFIFQMGSTLVTMAGSNVIAINNSNQTCSGSNVYWAIGSSATIDGAQFLGTLVATTSITMTSGVNVSGRLWALNGAVTMDTDTISICAGSGGGTVPSTCREFVTGGGWIDGQIDSTSHKSNKNDKATFGVSGGIKNGKFWGHLSYNDHSSKDHGKKNDHGKNGIKVKSTSITGYTVIDAVTRQIEGIAQINGKGSFTYKVIVVDNGEPSNNDSFSIELSNGYSNSGTLKGGNIQLHKVCGEQNNHEDEDYDDQDEKDGHNGNHNDHD